MGTFQTEILVKAINPPKKQTHTTWTKKSIDAKNHRYNTTVKQDFQRTASFQYRKGNFQTETHPTTFRYRQ